MGTTPAPVSSVEFLELERPAQDERSAQHRMPGERQLERGREDADPRVPVAGGRVDEDGLGEADLARERLLRLGNLARVGEDGELVPGEWDIREDIREDVAEPAHDATVPAPIYPSPPMLAIEVSGLRKAYGSLEAVRGGRLLDRGGRGLRAARAERRRQDDDRRDPRGLPQARRR